jgi:molybdopterin/thiamine biosynthesis adenylyltransferase
MGSRFKNAVKRAHSYAQEHPCIQEVSDIFDCNDGGLTFKASFEVNLPGRFDKDGITRKDVKKVEPVTFEFANTFPYTAPNIKLRDDFNRDFPHIYPTREAIEPCIFDGKLEDLLQQPKWMDGIYDHLSEWLEKAASDTLMDLNQGWEPIMADSRSGSIVYDQDILEKNLNDDFLELGILCVRKKPLFLFLVPKSNTEKYFSAAFFKLPDARVSDKYVSYSIKDFGDLCKFAEDNSIFDFRKKVNSISKECKYIAIIFAIRRPAILIGRDTSLEFVNFFIDVKRNSKNSKKHIKLKSKVYYLGYKDKCKPEILRKFSGIRDLASTTKSVLQIGCGSLGSKISLHLARSGHEKFILVDDSMFSPHNNARHALTSKGGIPKLCVLAEAMRSMGIFPSYFEGKAQFLSSDAFENIGNVVIIDSTASLAVRNFLATSSLHYPVIHTTLYDHSKLALIVAEPDGRNPRLDDLIIKIYASCIRNGILREKIFSDQSVKMSTGQGCSSYTTIAPDSRISLVAAGISAKIQHYLSTGMPICGEIFIGMIDDSDMGIGWERISCGKVTVIPPTETEWEVRIHQNVIDQIESESKQFSPLETGGALVGHISDANQCITICDLIPAPEDSKMTRDRFDLGILGLKEAVLKVIKKTNGLLTYVGTWHSHPAGGSSSDLDKITKERIKELGGISPTVCLIWTPHGILRT